ncbi:FapA family protein [Paenibacillus senegalensis]|uniref:FapA family protein n=1 Tax=Paenibacillus senegalensis TaxID=1465766 RepID=UPI000288195A|nr:FapA family protein [Paenibacillus senegalensis]
MNSSFDGTPWRIEVSISSDKLEAYMDFTRCEETLECSVDQLEALLRSKSVVYGIDFEQLARIAADPRSFLSSKVPVAFGEKPQPGTDGTVKTTVQTVNNRKPVEREDGKVDYREVNTMTNVKKGERLAFRIPPTAGVPGKTVTGDKIQAKNGKDVRFKVGKNVVADEENLNLYSLIDGVVSITDNGKINVFPIFEVNGDVDYSIGNLDFVGTIVIRGNVLTGFKVKAAGDIRITGGVEGAELEAGGSIVIQGGVLGHNKGVVRAGGSIRCAFVQEGHLDAGEDVVISQSIMHSTVKAGRRVVCVQSKGLIVGGKIQARESVAARIIGNAISTGTIIEVGVLPELRSELANLKVKNRSLADHLQKTEKALNLLDQVALSGNLSSDKLAMRIKLNHTKKQSLDEQEQIRERILQLEKSLEDTDKARVEVNSTIYGGTQLVLGRYHRMIKDPLQKVYFRIEGGDVAMFPLYP